MAIIKGNSQLDSALKHMLQGLAFWMGYYKNVYNKLYEHDCVHQAYTILRSILGNKEYVLEYEYAYSKIDKSIKTQERADLVILQKNGQVRNPICVMEFKMSAKTKGLVESDVEKLSHIKNDGVARLVILMYYEEVPSLRDRFTEERGLDFSAPSKDVPLKYKDNNYYVHVHRVAKAMASSSMSRRSPYMAICISVNKD